MKDPIHEWMHCEIRNEKENKKDSFESKWKEKTFFFV